MVQFKAIFRHFHWRTETNHGKPVITGSLQNISRQRCHLFLGDEQKNEDVDVMKLRTFFTKRKKIEKFLLGYSVWHARTHTHRIYIHTDRKRHDDTTQSPAGLQMNFIKFYFFFAENHSILITLTPFQSIIFNTKENTKRCEIKSYSITMHTHTFL